MTTKHRYLISGCILTACVSVALGVLAMLPPRPGVTKANFDRIEDGMTLAQVEAILGEPDLCMHANFQWIHADGAYIVAIMENSKVAEKRFKSSTETIPDKLRRWLHLQWGSP